MADDIDKVEKVFKAAWGLGKEFDEATGAHEAWATGAYQEDPALAQSAADDWDSGHHAKAIGKFVRASSGALWDAGSEFFAGVTGEVEAMAPPPLDIPMEPEQIGPMTEVAQEDVP